MHVSLRHRQLLMPRQFLNSPHGRALHRQMRAERVTQDVNAEWTEMVRRLGARLDPARRPHALAAIVVRPVPVP